MLAVLVPIIAWWMVTIPGIAQTTSGSISGTVTDASSASVPGAQVTAVNAETGAQRASVTGWDGRYQLPGLPPGIYDLRMEKEGFNTIIQQGIVLQVTQDAVLNVALRIGIVKQEFTVRCLDLAHPSRLSPYGLIIFSETLESLCQRYVQQSPSLTERVPASIERIKVH